MNNRIGSLAKLAHFCEPKKLLITLVRFQTSSKGEPAMEALVLIASKRVLASHLAVPGFESRCSRKLF